jgi:CubicO group peptidase (beta-lactamase class C family)
MTTTLRTRLALLGLAALVSPVRAAELDAKTIDALIDRALEEWQVPGAAVVIVDGDKTLYLAGRGLRERGKPERVTPDTVFPLASCSKAFTTTLMAMLADDGRFAWDDPVRKHLKDFHLADPLADGDVRLRDLVSHRTGVASHDLLWYRAAWGQDEMIRRVGKLPLSKPFRTAMQYQSIMFTAAGRAAANAGGKPWEDLVRARILTPLGMKSASLTTTAALKNPDHASGHRKTKDGEIETIAWYEQKEPNPAGSVNASARDLAPWLRLHLNLGDHEGERLVSAANLGATHSPQIVIPVAGGSQEMHPFTHQMAYAMAWVVQDYRGELLVSHAGLIDGFRVHLTLLPKRKLGLAVLCNLHQTRMNLALSNALVDHLLGAPAKDWNDHYRKIVEADEFAAKVRAARIERDRKRGTHPSLPLQNYAGVYDEPAYGTAKVIADGEGLSLAWSSFRCRLEHYEDDTFRARDEHLGQWPVIFSVKNGKVAEMSALGVTFARK